ncbi:MAG: hypothetical protein ACREC6_12330 [Hyphomicrobiaceae bacterium]
MKARDFAQFVEAFSDVLDEAGAGGRAEAWRALLPIFNIKPTANVGDICKVVAGMQCSAANRGATVQDVIGLLPVMGRCLASTAKKALVDDLMLLGKSLAAFRNVQVSNFVDAAVSRLRQQVPKDRKKNTEIRADVVQKYLRRLEQALGDEPGFVETFNAMKKDAAVGAAEAKKLSKEFSSVTARSKKDAFEFIWARHASLTGARLKAAATAGRTAA